MWFRPPRLGSPEVRRDVLRAGLLVDGVDAVSSLLALVGGGAVAFVAPGAAELRRVGARPVP